MSDDRLEEGNLVLSDLVNRVLDKGVVISGHVLISIADIDLLALDLKLILTSIETASRKQIVRNVERERQEAEARTEGPGRGDPPGNADAPVLPPSRGK